MTVRRVLIGLPVIVLIFLLQSYFWVPTYEEQTRGNPKRLQEYVTASIGDAQLLNPILSSDSASSDINGLVFEGLLDYDENLNFRGRLSTHWEIFEEAYFYVNDLATVPVLGAADGEQVARMIKEAKRKFDQTTEPLSKTLANIETIEVLPAQQRKERLEEKTADGKTVNVVVHIEEPPRIKLTLRAVDQELFINLKAILGPTYFSSFHGDRFIRVEPGDFKYKKPKYAEAYLPEVEHNPIIVFHLRPGVKFHDGHQVDAEDVKFTFEAIMNPANVSPRLADYEPVKTVDVQDPFTVQIVYKRLYSPALGTWAMGILPEHLLNRKALGDEARRQGLDPDTMSIRQSSFNRHPVGCGPFRFREWKSDQYVLLDRSDDYWEGPPNYLKYAYRIVPDMLTQEMEFYAGTVDSYGVQPHQVHRLKDDPRYQSFSGLSFGYTYIGYNLRRPPFDDVRVRRALGMAIDVDGIIRYVLYGQGEEITGPFPKQTDFYNHEVKPLPYDPEAAVRLLAEAGWKRNKKGWLEKDGKRLEFTLITNQGNNIRKAILSIVQDSWRKIGVDVRTDLLEWAVFIQERVNKLDFDALILGWSMGIEPDLYQIWHSSQSGPYRLNFVGFNNSEADELIIKIRQEYNREQQIADCHRLHEIIAEAQPYTFLFVRKWTALLDKRIVIMERDPEGKARYRKITPTKTGSYTFFFNKWIKLPDEPVFEAEG
ncbi:MAG: peptide ABC transporter substrate-binding protein [Deltaproteobacteria bacterium]|nr:MAG: peptide ABC transporter substrate-binding protein [Deltaproteobacteria bacterium]